MSSDEVADYDDPVATLLLSGHEDGLFSCAVAAFGGPDGPARTVTVGESDPSTGIRASPETLFDVASVTKPVVTTTVVLRLVEAGTVSLSDSLGDHVDEVADTRRGTATVEQLLTHTAGFQPYHYDPDWAGPSKARAAILEADVMARNPGEVHEYSCLSYVHLAALARAATGDSLEALARRMVFGPVGMDDARLGPLDDRPENTAVTYSHEHEDRRLKGEIHDPIARAMAGESGNAGLFATVGDLSRFARALLAAGTIDGHRVLSAATVNELEQDHIPSMDEPHGLGWRLAHDDRPAPEWSQHADGTAAIGHTGYTGSSLWVDRPRDRFAVLLTNAVLEDAPLDEFRERFHGVVAEQF